MKFQGKVAVITGAGRGLGADISRQFAKEGAAVVLVARTAKEIEKIAAEIVAAGGKALACAADISKEADVKAFVQKAVENFGSIDILINNAAVHKAIPVAELSLEDWNYQIGVNLTGTFLCSREVLPYMKKQRYGKIINISSSSAKYFFPGFGAYAASKGGIVSFSQTLAEEVKDDGINVNAIYLGLTNTEYTRSRMDVDPASMLQPEEVSKVVLFLASDDSSAIMGAAIDVFGEKEVGVLMISINKKAMLLVREILQDSESLGVQVSKMACGTTVIDMGIHCRGSWEAGLLFTRVTLGDLAHLKMGEFVLNKEYTFAATELYVEQPLIACLASQIAGWKLGEGEFATIGSGPARAVAAVESDPYLEMTPYRDRNDEVVLCIQDTKLPGEDIGQLIAKACGVTPENVYLLVAPSACIVGSIQVAARMIEQVCHKMYEKGFDVSQVVAARGKAPVAPVVKDEVKAMGRINDAILYGGETEFWVDSTDEKIAKVIHQLVSKTSSPNYGELFGEIFERAGKDFYHIDHDVHSIAKIQIHNINTGRAFAAGEINYTLLEKSFLK